MNTSTPRAAVLALVFALSGSVLLPAAPAQAVIPLPAPPSNITATGLGSITVPGSYGSIRTPFTVRFSGPATDPNDTNPSDGVSVTYDGYTNDWAFPQVVGLSSLDNAVVVPYFAQTDVASSVNPNTALAYRVTVDYDTSPGRYRMTVPISQNVTRSDPAGTDRQTATGTADFTVTANPGWSAQSAMVQVSGKPGKKATLRSSFNGPNYQDGAILRVYFKAKGSKKNTLIYLSVLNANGDKAITFRKGKIRKAGTMTFKVGAVAYSPGFSVTRTVR